MVYSGNDRAAAVSELARKHGSLESRIEVNLIPIKCDSNWYRSRGGFPLLPCRASYITNYYVYIPLISSPWRHNHNRQISCLAYYNLIQNCASQREGFLFFFLSFLCFLACRMPHEMSRSRGRFSPSWARRLGSGPTWTGHRRGTGRCDDRSGCRRSWWESTAWGSRGSPALWARSASRRSRMTRHRTYCGYATGGSRRSSRSSKTSSCPDGGGGGGRSTVYVLNLLLAWRDICLPLPCPRSC